jgi:hypothetical protein
MVQWIVFVRCADLVVVKDNIYSPCLFICERRPFLLPRARALRRMVSILLALVGEVGDVGLEGESLPALSDDEEVDLLRMSSARMSSKETLRWG